MIQTTGEWDGELPPEGDVECLKCGAPVWWVLTVQGEFDPVAVDLATTSLYFAPILAKEASKIPITPRPIIVLDSATGFEMRQGVDRDEIPDGYKYRMGERKRCVKRTIKHRYILTEVLGWTPHASTCEVA